MRYIDADELIEFFDSYPNHIEFDVEDIKSIINEQDTADVRESVKGEWIDRSEGGRILYPWSESFACSECGKLGTRVWNYCPNCGADVRGDQ